MELIGALKMETDLSGHYVVQKRQNQCCSICMPNNVRHHCSNTGALTPSWSSKECEQLGTADHHVLIVSLPFPSLFTLYTSRSLLMLH